MTEDRDSPMEQFLPQQQNCERVLTDKKVPVLCSQRWILAYLFFFGYFNVYALRVNISVAIVCMVRTPIYNSSDLTTSKDNITLNEQCGKQEVQSNNLNQRAEFDWDKSTQSAILASFFYGYIVTQIPGGWLADRFGGRIVYGVAMAIAGVSTLLTPICARTSVILVYILRAILGLATGVVFPVGHSTWGRWAPRLERSKLVATSHVGAIVGVVVTFGVSGVLCEYGFDNGWASIFYITGGFCCIWVLFWFYQVRDTPRKHPRISDIEKQYITDNIEYDTTKRTSIIPWKAMAKSPPLLAGVVCHMTANWANYTLITSLPLFMKEVLKFDIKSNGLLSAIPYVCTACMSVFSGHLADFLRSRHILTTTQTRRIFQVTAHISASVFLVSTGFVPCNIRDLAVAFLCLAVMSTGIMRGGFSVNHIDIAPKYAGILFGITNTMATIPGMVSPIVAGALTPNGTAEEWRNVFYVGAAFYILGAIVFGTFVSGDIQPWAKDIDDTPMKDKDGDLSKDKNKIEVTKVTTTENTTVDNNC